MAFDDLIIGAPGADPNGSPWSGESYVVFGFASSNAAPDAADDAIATDEDTSLSGSVFADNGNGPDTDADGDTLTVTQVNGIAAAVGTQITLDSGALLTLSADGSFDYNPNGQFEALNAGSTGTDSFAYSLSDGRFTDTATVTISIAGGTDAAQFSLADLDGSNGFVINGIDGNDSSGRSVSGAGDINGDGIDDLIIGAT